ncbi:12801_t:CDS:2, partial [Funneliformis caledonium]
ENISETSKENSNKAEPVLFRNYMERAFSTLSDMKSVLVERAYFETVKRRYSRQTLKFSYFRSSASKGEFEIGYERYVQTCEYAFD